MMAFFDSMYDVRRYPDRASFGDKWCGPERFEHGVPALVAMYPKAPADGDGQDVEVYCIALPSRCYEIRVLAGPNSVGEPKPGLTLRTGSSMQEFAAQFAEHVSQGMVGLPANVTGKRIVAECETEEDARLIAASPVMYSYIEQRAAVGDEDAARILERIHA